MLIYYILFLAELLKIYGDSINKEIPYKTLLLLPTDDTDTVIRAALDKYGLGREKTADYMMVQVIYVIGFVYAVRSVAVCYRN